MTRPISLCERRQYLMYPSSFFLERLPKSQAACGGAGPPAGGGCVDPPLPKNLQLVWRKVRKTVTARGSIKMTLPGPDPAV